MAESDREQLGEWLSAYIDGELSPEETKQVERFLREDAEARRTLHELRRTVNLVSSLPRHPAPDSVAEDVRVHIERSALLGDSGQSPIVAGGRRSPALALLAAAAAVALVAIGLPIMTGNRQPGPDSEKVALAPEGKDSGHRLAETPDLSHGGRALEVANSKEEPPDAERKILDSATLDQKLQAGKTLTCIREHRFSNEPVRLQVTVADAAQRDAVEMRLVSYLAERGAIELGTTDMDGKKSGTPVHGFVYRGDAGRNAFEPAQRQVLVRATRRQLDGMIEELDRVASPEDKVALTSGPVSVEGLRGVQAALTGVPESIVVARRARVPNDTTDTAMAAAANSSQAGREAVGELTTSLTDLFPGFTDKLDADAASMPAAPTASTRSGKGGDEVPVREIGAEQGAVTEPADRVADLSGRGAEWEGDLPTETASRTAEDSPDDREYERTAKGPAKRARARRSDRSLLERKASLVEEAKKKLTKSTVEPRSTSVDASGKGFAEPGGSLAVATPQPYAETYVTLVLQIEVAQPERAHVAKPAKTLPPRNAKPGTETDSVE